MLVFIQSKPKLLLYIQLYSDFFFSPPLNFSSEVFSSFPLNVSPITKWLSGGPEDSTKKNALNMKPDAKCIYRRRITQLPLIHFLPLRSYMSH